MFNGPVVEDPVSEAERRKVAGQCLADLRLGIPAVVDRMDDKVGRTYGGWPDRLYLIGTDGNVAYAGGPGPFRFDPEELAAAIRAELKTRTAGAPKR